MLAYMKAYSPSARLRFTGSLHPVRMLTGVAARERIRMVIAVLPVRCSSAWIGLTPNPPLKYKYPICTSGIQAPINMTACRRVGFLKDFICLIVPLQVHPFVKVSHLFFITIEHQGIDPSALPNSPFAFLRPARV